MTRRSFVVLALVMALAAAGTVTAQQPDRAALRLQAAQQKETVEGDLAGAIRQYQAIALTYGKSNRQVAAKALLRMAAAYEQLGDAQAQKTWARVVAEFADQRDAVAEARVRLAASGKSSRPSRNLPVSRQVTSHYSTADVVTPEGRYLAGTDWDTGDLLVRDLTTREERRPVRGRATGGRLQDFAQDPRFSPDMTRIAYSWFADDGSGRASNSLQVVSAESGGVPRTIVSRDMGSGYFSLVGWSPDARSLLVTIAGSLPNRGAEIAWVSVETGAVRTVKTFDPWQVSQTGDVLGKVSLSPDGRWIAYSAVAGKDSSDRHVYVVAADGSGPNPLTRTAGMSASPVWTQDGSRVLFVADWSGSFGLWSVPVRAGQPSGAPALVKADVGQIDAIGVTAAGSFYYNYRYDGGSRTFVARTSLGRASAPRQATPVLENVTADFAGGLAAWSPDGSRVAFVRQRASGGRTVNELGVRVMATGEERVFNSRVVALQQPIWFHSRDALLVFASDDGEPGSPATPSAAPLFMKNGAFFVVDVATGRFSRALPVLSERYRRSPVAVLSPDDRTLYTMGDPLSTGPVSFDDLLAIDMGQQTERTIHSITSPGDMRAVPSGVGLALSPDGRTLAIASRAGSRDANRPWLSEQTTLSVIGVDGGGYRQLHGPYASVTLAKVGWSLDGSAVHFIQASGAYGWEVMSIARDGGAPVPTGIDMQALRKASEATGNDRSERLAAALDSLNLHPDGSSILFSSAVNPRFEIWALDGVGPASRK